MSVVPNHHEPALGAGRDEGYRTSTRLASIIMKRLFESTQKRYLVQDHGRGLAARKRASQMGEKEVNVNCFTFAVFDFFLAVAGSTHEHHARGARGSRSEICAGSERDHSNKNIAMSRPAANAQRPEVHAEMRRSGYYAHPRLSAERVAKTGFNAAPSCSPLARWSRCNGCHCIAYR